MPLKCGATPVNRTSSANLEAAPTSASSGTATRPGPAGADLDSAWAATGSLAKVSSVPDPGAGAGGRHGRENRLQLLWGGARGTESFQEGREQGSSIGKCSDSLAVAAWLTLPFACANQGSSRLQGALVRSELAACGTRAFVRANQVLLAQRGTRACSTLFVQAVA